MTLLAAPRSRSRRDALRALIGCAALGVARGSVAQAAKHRRVAYLAPDSRDTRTHEGFREGMRDHGYVEGRNVEIDWRFAEGRYDRLPALAADIVAREPDVIVANTSLAVQAVAKATAERPIVMVAVADPVGEGFAKSLASPGGNLTGLSSIVAELSEKHVQLLQDAVPKLARVATLVNPHNAADALILRRVQGAASARGLKLVVLEASTPAEIERAFERMGAERAQALVVAADPFFDTQWKAIAGLANGRRLPSIFASRGGVEAGALMSYGQDISQHCRRVAGYVQKILAGAPAHTLPIEQPRTFELVVNQRTARALGLAVPRELLLRADTVID